MKPSPSAIIDSLNKKQLLGLIEKADTELTAKQSNERRQSIQILRTDLANFFRRQLTNLINDENNGEPNYSAIETISGLLKGGEINTLCEKTFAGDLGLPLKNNLTHLIDDETLAEKISHLNQLQQTLESKDDDFFRPQRLKRQIDAKQEDLNQTKQFIKAKQSELDELDTELQQQKQANDELPNEIITLKEKLASQQHRERALMQQLQQVQQNIQWFTSLLTAKQNKADGIQKRLEKLEQSKAKNTEGIETAKNEKLAIEREIAALQEVYDHIVQGRAELIASAYSTLQAFLQQKEIEQNNGEQPEESNEVFKEMRVLLAIGDTQKLITKYEKIMKEIGLEHTTLGFSKRRLSSTTSGEGYDAVLMVKGTLNKTMVRDIIVLAKSSNIPLITIDSTNQEQIEKQLLSELKG